MFHFGFVLQKDIIYIIYSREVKKSTNLLRECLYFFVYRCVFHVFIAYFLTVCLQAKIMWNVLQDIFHNFLAHLSNFGFCLADWGIAIISKSEIVQQLVRQLVKPPF